MNYVEIEYKPTEPWLLGRWYAWLRAEDGDTIALRTRITRRAAERAGHDLLRAPKVYRLAVDDVKGGRL